MTAEHVARVVQALAKGQRRRSELRLWLRSSLFSIGFVLATLVFAPLSLFTFPFPLAARYRFITRWTAFNIWWLGKTCRLYYRVEGRNNMPETPAIVLSKHESTWETFALQLIFRPQVWVLKRELLWIPFFGWGLAMLRPIAINRRAGPRAIRDVVRQGGQRLRAGCWVVIFPEGTRMAPGTRGRYQLGGAVLAKQTGYPLVPVAHNAGDFWPRKGFVKRPGTIRVIIGPTISPTGQTAAAINRAAETWIEDTVAQIRAQTRAQSGPVSA